MLMIPSAPGLVLVTVTCSGVELPTRWLPKSSCMGSIEKSGAGTFTGMEKTIP
jgi:hypothetical protein